MDKDRAKGKLNDIKGRVKRQAGEWTGNEDLQAEGAAEQVQGKAQNVAGKVKDTGRQVMDDARRKIRGIEREHTAERDRGKKAA